MSKSKIIVHSLAHAAGVLLYIVAIYFFINAMQTWFGPGDPSWAPIAFLLLLVFSAATMAVLIFGRPVYLFLSGAKKEGIHFLSYTLGWIFLIFIIFIACMWKFSPRIQPDVISTDQVLED